MNEHSLRIGSLFSGYGGLDMAVTRALDGNANTMWVSDIEPGPNAILAYRYPHAPNLGDITRICWDEVPDVDIICGGSPCFPAGSLVFTNRGLTPIEQVREGDLVLTHLSRWRPVLRTGSHEGDTIIVKGQGSAGIECTPNHPFLAGTRRGSGFTEDGWIPAVGMTGRMWLNMGGSIPPLNIPRFDFTGCQTRGIRLSRAFMYFVGRWLGDGWLSLHRRKHRKRSLMKRVFVCDSFDKERELRERLEETGLHFTVTHERTCVRFCCSSTTLYDWLESNFGKGAAGKHVPAWAYGMREDWREAMLQGYRDSDGGRDGNGWHATTVSKELAYGIKLLASSLGMDSSISYHKPSRTRCVIEGRVVPERGQWRVSWYERSRRTIREERGFWAHISAILPGRQRVRVYNLEVAEDHSYTVDGIAVRNCQSLSIGGLRAGMHEGTRSGLWSYQRDAVEAKRPRMLIWENVAASVSATASSKEDIVMADRRAELLERAGLCSCDEPTFDNPPGFTPPARKGEKPEPADRTLLAWMRNRNLDPSNTACTICGRRLFEATPAGFKAGSDRLQGAYTAPTIRALGRVLGDLANLDYSAVWQTVEAADAGAPHHRARMFVVAWPNGPDERWRLPAGGPWGVWNAGRDVWETGQADLFGQADVFADTWPANGLLVRGGAYSMPDGLLESANGEALTLMPTPKASDSILDVSSSTGRPLAHSTALGTQMLMIPGLPGSLNTEYVRRHDARQTGRGRDGSLPATPPAADGEKAGPNQRFDAGFPRPAAQTASLLPTPMSRDGGGGGAMNPSMKRARNHAVTLQDVVEKGDLSMLPTPMSRDGDGRGAADPERRRLLGHAVSLPDMVEQGGIQLLPTPCAFDSAGENMQSTRQKPGLMHAVALPDAIRMMNVGDHGRTA